MGAQRIAMLIFAVTAFGAATASAHDLPPAPPRAAKPLTPEERAELMALKIRAGANIKVKSYDRRTRTFDVMIKTEPSVGPNTTSLENLKRAMGEPTAARRLGAPEDWVGREMTLVQDLILLPDMEPPAPAKPGKPATRRGSGR